MLRDEAKKQGISLGKVNMLGWTILFALMSLSGAVPTLAGHPAPLCLKTASFIFAMLFFLSLLTRAVRGRTHG
jgi:hypothetical protein